MPGEWLTPQHEVEARDAKHEEDTARWAPQCRFLKDIIEDHSFHPAERAEAERQMDQLRAEHPTLEALYEADVERERAE